MSPGVVAVANVPFQQGLYATAETASTAGVDNSNNAYFALLALMAIPAVGVAVYFMRKKAPKLAEANLEYSQAAIASHDAVCPTPVIVDVVRTEDEVMQAP